MLAPATAAHAQWVLAVYGGAAHTPPTDIRLDWQRPDARQTFDDVAFAGRSFESPIYYGYRVIRVVSPRPGWLVGGEFIHAKAYARPFSARVQHLAMSHGLNFVFADIGIRRRVADRVSVNAMAGIGPALPHVEAETDGVRREGYQVAGVGVQAASGVDWRAWRRVSVLAEYKWTRAALHLDLDPGAAELAPSVHHFAIGVSLELPKSRLP